MQFDHNALHWTREPLNWEINDDTIRITTRPHTDLWQRTYYHFRNDNAPVLQMTTDERYFSFVVRTEFDSKHRFDQCGVVMYLDSENWLKASIEYENERFQHLGSVVTNLGYSDWATTEIDASIKSMWYRLSRREDDFCIECSEDGRPSARCAFATCIRPRTRFRSAFTRAARRIPRSARPSHRCSSCRASGRHTTARNRTTRSNKHWRDRADCGFHGLSRIFIK